MSFWWKMALAAALVFPAAAIAAAGGSLEQGGTTGMVIAQSATTPPEQAAATQDSAAPEAAAEAATSEEAVADEGPVEFTEEFMHDPAIIETGKMVWETCAGCHGSRAYPGKAPKLRPSRYTPEFVFDRVTNGYKKMPAWKDIFTKDERRAVTAWVLSDNFVP
jgi:mono/diheme cytochrome c family protein